MLFLIFPALAVLLPTAAAAAGPHPSLVSSMHRQHQQRQKRSSFWGVRGGQHEEQQPVLQPPGTDENAQDAMPPPPRPFPTEAPLPAPEILQHPPPPLPVVQTEDNDTNHDSSISINKAIIHPLTFTEDERDVLDALSTAPTWEKLLHVCGKIEGIQNSPDVHLKISQASRGDAVLASMALVRLARLVSMAGEEGGSEGETVEAISARVSNDRRVEQLLDCAACHIDNLSVHDISNLLYSFSVLQIQEPDFLARLFTAATVALQHDRWPSLQPSELVTLTWSLAHLQARSPSLPRPLPFIDALETRLLSLVPALTPHDLARLSWALSILLQNYPSLSPSLPLLHKISEATFAHFHNFSSKDLVMVACSLAGLGVGGERKGGVEGWREGLAKALGGRLAELGVEDLAAVARTFAWWGEGGREGGREVLMLELLVCAEAKKVDLLRAGGREGGSGMVDVMYCFAINDFRNATGFMARELPEVFAAAIAGATTSAAGAASAAWNSGGEWSATDFTKLLWACVSLMEKGGVGRDGGGGGAGAGVGGGKEQQFLQQQHLLSALAGRTCVRVLETLSPSSSSCSLPPSLLVQLAWSLATLGHYDPDLFTVLSHSVLPVHLPSLSLSEMASLSWSFASIGHHVQSRFFDRVVMVLEQQHAHFSLKDLAMCLWAVALTGYECLGVFAGDRKEGGMEEWQGGWVKEKEEELRAMRPSEVVKFFWALAKLLPRQNNMISEEGKKGTLTLREELLNAICQDLRTKLATFSPQDLVMTTWALARLYGPIGPSDSALAPTSSTKKLLSHLCKQLPARLPFFTATELASLLLSLGTLHQPLDTLWNLFKKEVERRLKMLLDSEEVGISGGGERGRNEEGEVDGFFHLARCQAALSVWKGTDGDGGGIC